jgi:hypothetical protein
MERLPARLRLTLALTLGALVAWSGLILQFDVSRELLARQGIDSLGTLWRMLGYFTILTNLLTACYYSLRLLAPASTLGRWLARPTVGTALAMYLALVMIIVHLILRHLVTLEGWALLADDVLHYVTPLLFIVFWVICVPKRTLRWSDAWPWLIYPVAYLAYALIRGALSGFYPYPFIDVSKLGYGAVAVNGVGIAVAFTLAAFLVVAIDRHWPRAARGQTRTEWD